MPRPATNCLIFALALYFRRRSCGNARRLIYRRSRNSILPHFLYQEARRGRERVVHYVPLTGGDSESAPLFRGRVKWGDQ